MVQHYLDGMFPLRRDPQTGRLVRREDGVPWGAEEEGNEFMESEVLVGGGADGTGRDGKGECEDEDEVEDGEAVEVHGVSPVLARKGTFGSKGGKKPTVKVKVKELSRLWQYRNGKSPEETLPSLARGLDGAVRHATL